MESATDRQLWRRATAGDADAFGTLFDRHAKTIYNYCFRRTADWSTAEDLTATVFLEAWRRRQQVRLVDDSLLPWLYVVGANLIRNRRRRLHRQREALVRLPRDRAAASDEIGARLDEEDEMRQMLKPAWNREATVGRSLGAERVRNLESLLH